MTRAGGQAHLLEHVPVGNHAVLHETGHLHLLLGEVQLGGVHVIPGGQSCQLPSTATTELNSSGHDITLSDTLAVAATLL